MLPSLLIRADRLEPRGAFAEAQAAFLDADPAVVATLDSALAATGAGVVAHFYMDAELQGTLARVRSPHVFVADSLQMAEKAVAMAEAGARAVVVLGVDFMSENVRATLDGAGFAHVPVLRVSDRPIGCSLAAAADSPAYGAYLSRAAETPRSLHVIYVNTSLTTKARAERLLPTITCTSSNVIQTVLTAAAALPDVHVWFGPDTYMGHNLQTWLAEMAKAPEATVRAVHPAHSPRSLTALRERLHVFEEGVCVVHHMFGARVVERVLTDHPDALLTAHFEVPGEMFRVALAAAREGRGVVGSTSNILAFIGDVAERAARGELARPQVVLGTESGMTTAVVRRVQGALRGTEGTVELLFPVAAEAIAPGAEGLAILPGPAAGEGCAPEGGCATCPYMKMNSLDALTDLLAILAQEDHARLAPFAVGRTEAEVEGEAVAPLAVRTIARMRAFSKSGAFPEELTRAVLAHG